jgi:hypothetical protein
VRLEGLPKLKKFNDLIRTGTCDLLACSIAPQPSTLPCASASKDLNEYKQPDSRGRAGSV